MLEAYSVAVKLRLVNEVSAGLAAISVHMKSTGKDAAALQAEMNKIRMMGMAGLGMAAVGAAGLAMFRVPLKEAKLFQVEVAKFSSLGFGSAINNEASRFASAMGTIGTSARDNMMIVGDAMAVFKDLHEAKMVAPLMAKMKFANEVIFGAGGGDRDKKLMDMMKVAEFRGGTRSPEEFARQVNFAQQAIAGSRNRVDSSAMLQALKTGGVGISRRTNEAFYLGAEPLIQEFGGMRYGTGVMSLYQNLVQAKGSITSQQELNRLGLLNKSMIQYNNLGMLKKALPGAFIGSKIQEEEGELALLNKVLLPAFAKHGITSDEDVIREIGRIAGNRTGSNLLARIYQQRVKLEQQVAANYHAENLDQASARASVTLQGKEADLHAKWATLMKDLGVTVLPMAITAVTGLTAVLKGAAHMAETFPRLTGAMMGALGSLSLALLGGGVALGVNAAIRGLALAMPGLTGGTVGVMGALGKAGLLGSLLLLIPAAYELSKMFNFGGWLYDKTHSDKDVNGWRGNKFVGAQNHPLYDPMSMGNTPRPETMARGGQGANFIVHNTFDAHGITTKIVREMSNAASRPQSGISGFDASMMFPSVANQF